MHGKRCKKQTFFADPTKVFVLIKGYVTIPTSASDANAPSSLPLRPALAWAVVVEHSEQPFGSL